MRFAGKSIGIGLFAMAIVGCRGGGAVPDAGSDAASAAPEPPSAGEAVRFIDDDYTAALAEARKRGVPLFVDAWAAWCHTCLSMRAFVFSDPAMKRMSDRFVWLAIDTEREKNAPVVARLGVKVLPTLFVVDPASEEVRLAHAGSLTAEELLPLLATVAAADAGKAPETKAERLERLRVQKQAATCVSEGADEAAALPPGTELADVLRATFECTRDLPAQAPERVRMAQLLALTMRLVSAPDAPILADDRSDLYDYLVDALRDAHLDDEAKRQAQAWVAFLDAQAARAPNPAARAVFDAHRLLAYTAVGDPGRAVPMLQQSERDFPDDYDPPARLGKAYFDMKQYDDALSALDRALKLAYGPRKLRFWSLEADVCEAKGDPACARRALQAAVDFAGTVPLTGAYPQLRDSLAGRLAAMPPAKTKAGSPAQ
jgi:tetratricopeptide (TPR) repeat protein